MATRVLLALDGTELDERLAIAAHDLFGDGAEYFAINVSRVPIPVAMPIHPAVGGFTLPSDAELGSAGGEAGRSPLDEAAAAGEAVARRTLAEAGVDADVRGEVGEPASAILDAADDTDADVVVLGTHGRSWWSHLFEPSVSAAVIRRAHRPVLVVNTQT